MSPETRWTTGVISIGRRATSRSSSPGLKGLLLLATSILLVSIVAVPASGANQLQPLTSNLSYVPPFNGSVTNSTSTSSTGCGTVLDSYPGLFNLSNGSGGFAGSTSGITCSGNKSSGTSINDHVEVIISVPYTAGRPTIYANFSYSVAGSIALKMGKCKLGKNAQAGNCNGGASFELTGSTYFVDLNAKRQHQTFSSITYPTQSMSVLNVTTCKANAGCSTTLTGAAGSFSYSGNFSQKFVPPQNMNATHKYEIVWDAYFNLASGVGKDHAKLSSSSASASANAGTGGNFLDLDSLTEI